MLDLPELQQVGDVRQRFLTGLARAAGLDEALLDRSGTSVLGRQDRADSGAMVHYRAGAHGLIWCDPDLVGRFESLRDEQRTADAATITEQATGAGLELLASADMRVITGAAPDPAPLAVGYQQYWLQAENSAHVDLIRAFADRSDPDDVEQAALDDLENFDELAINVATLQGSWPGDSIGDLVAYGSACSWPWDAGFADIGVLVDGDHRGHGLGAFVVAHTSARLRADGMLPLYRHGHDNQGSKRIAIGNGFETVTTLDYFCIPSTE